MLFIYILSQNTKIGNVALLVKTLTADEAGNAHFPTDGYTVLLAVATNTVNTTLSIGRNQYNMYYVNIKNGNGLPYAGTFTIWGLVSY